MSKNLHYNKKIKEETEAFQKMIENYTTKLKKEYEKKLLNTQIALLEIIAEGEELNIIELKEKYLQTKKKQKSKKETSTTSLTSENLLEKTKLNGITYYYDNKEGGNVYNNNSVVVGLFKDGKINLKSTKT
jgi:hypothetical protein